MNTTTAREVLTSIILASNTTVRYGMVYRTEIIRSAVVAGLSAPTAAKHLPGLCEELSVSLVNMQHQSTVGVSRETYGREVIAVRNIIARNVIKATRRKGKAPITPMETAREILKAWDAAKLPDGARGLGAAMTVVRNFKG